MNDIMKHMQIKKRLSQAIGRHFVCMSIIVFAIASASGFVGSAMHSAHRLTNEIRARTIVANEAYQRVQRVKQARQAKLAHIRNAEAEAKRRPRADIVHYSDTCTPVVDPASITVIVSKTRCFNPKKWQPNDLVSIGDNEYLRAEAAAHYTNMKQAITAAGMSFSPSSAYRSYDDQVVVYDYWVTVNKNTDVADLVSARPGYSEHQTGLAVDVKLGSCALECFATTPTYAWLREHGAEYGFIQRYPEKLASITGYETEVWHWRYVGVEIAQAMRRLGIETLELYMQFMDSERKYGNSENR